MVKISRSCLVVFGAMFTLWLFVLISQNSLFYKSSHSRFTLVLGVLGALLGLMSGLALVSYSRVQNRGGAFFTAAILTMISTCFIAYRSGVDIGWWALSIQYNNNSSSKEMRGTFEIQQLRRSRGGYFAKLEGSAQSAGVPIDRALFDNLEISRRQGNAAKCLSMLYQKNGAEMQVFFGKNHPVKAGDCKRSSREGIN